MPITVNEGGTLYTLDTVTANEGGTLYELDTVYSNEGGVLYEIFGSASAPKSLTWHYSNAPDETPTVSNNGFTVENSNKNWNYDKYQSVETDTFTLKGEWNITVNLTRGNCVSASASLIDADGNHQAIVVYPFDVTGTITAKDGEYTISCGGGYGDQSGSSAGTYKCEITFEKA